MSPFPILRAACRAPLAGLVVAIGLLVAAVALAATPADTALVPGPETEAASRAEPAPLVVWNREVTVFRTTYQGLSPEERAEAAARRIRDLPPTALRDTVRSQAARLGAWEGRIIDVGGHALFGILPGDVDSAAGETFESKVAQAEDRLHEALSARARSQSTPLLLRGVLFSALATFLLVLLLSVARRLRRRLWSRFVSRPGPIAKLRIAGWDLDHQVRGAIAKLADLLFWVFSAFALYLWITFVLSQFPYTQPWGEAFGDRLLGALATLGLGVLHALPGLGMVVLIFFVTRIALNALARFFEAIERERISFPGIHSDTAAATRRILTALLWIFAIVVAYPYLPGSQTEVFKGISVLAGLLVTLGASGVFGQVMSGLVVIYSRAVRLGEFVRIGEHEGIVSEIGMLSAKIKTIRKEEITIPNSVLVSTVTTNYSRLAGDEGAILATSISVGYDFPWRQVHALMTMAASRTSGVRKDPPPRILQRSLSDFAVEYQLHVHIERSKVRIFVLSELHGNILDAFNEFGVQILVPHYESQPDRRVFVPRDRWHDPPATPRADTESEGGTPMA